MSRNDPKLRARLMARAEAVIDELLARQKVLAKATLADIEQGGWSRDKSRSRR